MRFMSNHQPLSLSELNQLLLRVQVTMELLVGGQAHTSSQKSSKPTQAGKPGKPAGTRSRAGAAELKDELIAVLRSGKGLQFGEVVKRVGAAAGPVQYHLQALRAKKRVRVVGKRSAARWFAA